MSGPSWLSQDISCWQFQTIKSIKILEYVKVSLLVNKIEPNTIFERFSSFTSLIRFIAYCLRLNNKNKPKHTHELSITELQGAELRIIKLVQENTLEARCSH